MKKFRYINIFFYCLLLLPSLVSSQYWAKSVGGGSDDRSNSIAVDGNGNVYVTGYFSGTADFDPSSSTTNLTSNGITDIFLTKYNPTGELAWAKSMGGILHAYSYDIAVDSSGNVYVTGDFYGTVDFDLGSGTYNLSSDGGSDIFFAKYNSSGEMIWAYSLGSGGDHYSRSIAVDNSGNVYLRWVR